MALFHSFKLRRARSIIAAFGIVTVALLTSNAIPAEATTGAVDTQSSCVLVASKVKPGNPDATLTFKGCADSQQSAAALAPASIPLVTVYQNSGLEGLSATIYGDGGPCDSAGYAINDLRNANNLVHGISSYATYNECNGQSLWTEINLQNNCGFFGPTTQVNIPYACNDHLYSMKVYKFYV